MNDYFTPKHVEEALALLTDPERHCLIVAGATDLAVQTSPAHLQGRTLVDVSQTEELRGFGPEADGFWLGASLTFSEVMRCPQLPQSLLSLRQAAEMIGSPQIRNIATIGGNLGTASPGGDMNVALSGLDALVRVAGRDGRREISIDKFFTGAKQNVLLPHELILGVWVRLPERSAYRKLGLRRSLALAVTSLSLSEYRRGTRRRWLAAYAALAPTPFRATQAQLVLEQGGTIEQACDAVIAQAMRLSGKRRNSLRGSVEYKQEMAAALLAETLTAWGYAAGR